MQQNNSGTPGHTIIISPVNIGASCPLDRDPSNHIQPPSPLLSTAPWDIVLQSCPSDHNSSNYIQPNSPLPLPHLRTILFRPATLTVTPGPSFMRRSMPTSAAWGTKKETRPGSLSTSSSGPVVVHLYVCAYFMYKYVCACLYTCECMRIMGLHLCML